MKFETGQHLKAGQQLRLAPRVIQAMEILQLPLPALEEKIEQELESNIALELVENDLEDIDPNEVNSEDDYLLSEYVEDQIDPEYDEVPAKRLLADQERRVDVLANIRARKESLAEQLQQQWTFADVSEEILSIGSFLIHFIDDNGFITLTETELIEKIHQDFDKQIDVELLHRTIASLQQFLDPAGIAARSLHESLLIQVNALKRDDPSGWEDVYALIDNHLEDILENRLPKIAKETGFSIDRVKDSIALMHELTLSPGKLLHSESVLPIIPDAVIELDEHNDTYVVGIREGNLPPLRVSKEYSNLTKDPSTDDDAKQFIQRNLNAARWIIEAVSQRKSTLQNVVQIVADRQRDFLEQGDSFLRPLPMIDVADMLGVHVATVSRAVSDKWIQTPRGIFPLRRFFSGGTGSQTDGEMSWEAVKTRLQEIVDVENKHNPLSDQAIADCLREQGIDIARRTVVKYRQQLDIPAARIRKQY